MPLLKSPSKKALSKNIETEMDAHPSPEKRKQNLAVAYSVQRQAKKKKMAEGGEVRPSADERLRRSLDMLEGASSMHSEEIDARREKMSGIDDADDEREMRMMASGGEVDARKERMVDEDEMPMYGEDMLEDESIHASIRRKMAKGGEVDVQESNGDESLNDEDDLSFEAARKKTYFDDSQLSAQPEDSNEHADELDDEDEHDMVDVIRRKIKSKSM